MPCYYAACFAVLLCACLDARQIRDMKGARHAAFTPRAPMFQCARRMFAHARLKHATVCLRHADALADDAHMSRRRQLRLFAADMFTLLRRHMFYSALPALALCYRQERAPCSRHASCACHEALSIERARCCLRCSMFAPLICHIDAISRR